ncbi:MAG: hypothetical protein QM778_27625 [Myxococcales bacterium]
MSSSIRPPGGSPPTPTPGGPGESSRIRGAEAAEPTRPAGGVDQASQVGSTQQGAAAGGAESATARWIRRLEAGEVTRTEAIEGLVAQAVEQRGGQRLSPAVRAELEGVLRAALLGDPVLGRLLGGP